MRPKIAIVATLDTKGKEAAFLQSAIRQRDCDTLVVDVGVFGPSGITVDVSRDEVSRAGGLAIEELLTKGDRSLAVHTMATGGAKILKGLFDRGRFDGIVSVGGGTGTNITAGIMRGLPVGLPKLIVSTVASRDMSGVVGSKDITIMHAVADILGINFMTRKILGDAAGAIVGMVRGQSLSAPDTRVIGLTSYGPLNQCAFQATELLGNLGYEVVSFHAVGPGSMAMEDLIGQGVIHGVLDLALHEFADQLHNGYCGLIGPARLETAGSLGVPHVILPGGLDMVAFESTSLEGIPRGLQDRTFLAHDFRSFVRTTRDDMKAVAGTIAEKLNRANHPPTLIIPLNGWSKADAPGGPFYDPEVNQVFITEIKSLLNNRIKLLEVAANINDDACARLAVSELHSLMEER